ncbi:hypothetical protein [Sagittula sp. S175]|uniref:hypothetical protein n=1 Tax=Sagittula sp. S175 TaxID=3415129 RepID=UPI003C7B0775
MGIGQELLNVPMGDMIRQMAFAIADGQTKLDENSMNTAEMMGGLTTVYDEKGNVSFDDSRVFFGYEYMSLAEAVSYAIMDDAMTGTLDDDEANSLFAMVKKIATTFGVTIGGTRETPTIPNTDVTTPAGQTVKAPDLEIRMPTRMSMMELGFGPTFYQFVDTIIEVKIAIKITRDRSYTRTTQAKKSDVNSSSARKRSFWGTSKSSSYGRNVATSQVDATYSNRYSYSAEGASILRTKIMPVPLPTALEDRIQSFIETEEARREAALAARKAAATPPTP